MQFVLVGDAGNDKDPLYGFGHVPYVFEIGKYQVSNQEYCAFLNAVAVHTDPHGLYSPSMSSGLFGGISRRADAGAYEYAPKVGWERRPVVYVSWYDLARLANWHHFGRKITGSSHVGTTEGTSTSGAYDTRRFPRSGSDYTGHRRLPFSRNKGALYWIPSENEWYKAAYFDPARQNGRRYWNYPTRSNIEPNNSPPPGDQDSINFFSSTFALGRPFFLNEVGAYRYSHGCYGAYDLGGNVWEWLESWRLTDREHERVRGLRGGSATYNEIGLHARNTDPGNPSHEKFIWGGRLARAYTNQEGEAVYSSARYRKVDWYRRRALFRAKRIVRRTRRSWL